MTTDLLVLGTGPGPGTPGAADLLADADLVFAFPPGPAADPESVALFYAEAWRVETVSPRAAVTRIATWAAERAGRTAVLLVAGDPADDVALRAVLDGLGAVAGGVAVRVCAEERVAPPFRSTLPG
ncbi:hypothetical protein [Pseudonocardia phyllosphaerae]|uniref:hypothetical protein n=1 Tax=Pseudonocardia phyllosphaerae TaxID=3390502 RepID=UPI00397C760C